VEETMRFPMLITTAAAILMSGATVAPAATTAASSSKLVAMSVPMAISAAQNVPEPEIKVDINLADDRTVWYADPFWIVIGVAVIGLIVVLVALSSRGGGGTTVIR
jgi:hypothetical protein